jgi:hypothetical protein
VRPGSLIRSGPAALKGAGAADSRAADCVLPPCNRLLRRSRLSAGRPPLTGTRLIDELINEARNGDTGDMSGARARVIGQTAISGALDWAQRSGMKMPKW